MLIEQCVSMAQPNKPMNTQVLLEVVRQSADAPTYLRGLGGQPQHSPQRPTVHAMDAAARPQPVPTSAKAVTMIRGRENAEVDPQVPGDTIG